MSELQFVEDGASGKRYFVNGCIPFVSIDLSQLEWGDSIRDNNGKGMIMYVNQCCDCKKKFLGGTLIMVPYECKSCADNFRFKLFNDWED